ncbi:hypothetical protein [Faucicola boevrei]|uniref:hypothetical protein n=1 Tax=Faucicola boevrei TaxID=346665 RepID=UPI00036B08DD|nr:hypothetical protein [Moraxella boevrei]
MGIDTTGAGIAVAEHVKAFYSYYTGINYSIEVKTRMALRIKELSYHRKIQFDAGYILYLSDPLTTQADVDILEQAVKESKGAGNFKNLFMYVPNGKADGAKVIPLAEVAAKDEFMNIKIASRDDQLAGHRVPPQLMGIVPSNAGGFGDIKKAAEVFYFHEILPIINLLTDLNAKLGEEIISFKEYDLKNL